MENHRISSQGLYTHPCWGIICRSRWWRGWVALLLVVHPLYSWDTVNFAVAVDLPMHSRAGARGMCTEMCRITAPRIDWPFASSICIFTGMRSFFVEVETLSLSVAHETALASSVGHRWYCDRWWRCCWVRTWDRRGNLELLIFSFCNIKRTAWGRVDRPATTEKSHPIFVDPSPVEYSQPILLRPLRRSTRDRHQPAWLVHAKPLKRAFGLPTTIFCYEFFWSIIITIRAMTGGDEL